MVGEWPPLFHGEWSSRTWSTSKLCPMHFSIWLFLCILYNKLVSVSKYFSEFCEPVSQINQTQGEVCGTLLLITGQSEAQVTTWTCDWCLKWEQSCED